MLYSSFISEIQSTLREQAKDICMGNIELRKLCYQFIDDFCIYLTTVENSIYTRIVDADNAKERDYSFNNGIMSCSLLLNGRNNPILTLEILQRRTKIYHFDKFAKYAKVKKKGHVYFISCEHGIKIGKSGNLNKRIQAFEVNLPFKITPIYHIIHNDFNKIESELHQLLKDCRLNGEWFDLTDEDWLKIRLYCHENKYELKQIEYNG